MKIVFASNYFNHHQRPLCDALYQITGGSFSFIETAPMGEDRRQLGYGWDAVPGYVLTAYQSASARQRAMELILEADVVLAGSVPETYLKGRIRAGKLIFRYGERPLKRGNEWPKYLPRLIRWHLRNPVWKPVYLLAASAYAPGDYAKFGLFRHKAFRWGYFPEGKRYDVLPEKEENSILWAGRFLDWKHPEDALRAAAILRDAGYSFRLRFIGAGPMEQQLRHMTTELGLEAQVTFLGSMKPEQVRKYMELSGILLLSSDRQEGWGAVVNEAMNSGCAVVASHAAGSVPYLLEHGKNGLIYRSGDVAMLSQHIRTLLDSPGTRAGMGRAACETITGVWNGEIAAKRLVALAAGLLDGTGETFETGPCSPAPVMGDDWFPARK